MSAEDRIWLQINHELVDLELDEAFSELVKETEQKVEKIREREHAHPRSDVLRHEISKVIRQEFTEWLRKIDRAYTNERRTRGKQPSPEFVQAVANRAIQPAIDEPQKFEAKLMKAVADRTGMLEDWKLQSSGFWFGETINLENEWKRRTKIRALRLKLKAKRSMPDVSGASRRKSRRGRKGRRPHYETQKLDQAVIEAIDQLSRSLQHRPSTRDIVDLLCKKTGAPLVAGWRQKHGVRDWCAVARSKKLLRLAAKRFSRVSNFRLSL